jgi:hypothetical protein
LFLNFQATDTSRYLNKAHIQDSKHQTEEYNKFGDSIKNLWPSKLKTTSTHGTFKTMENPTKWKWKLPTPDGGRSSGTLKNISATFSILIDA